MKQRIALTLLFCIATASLWAQAFDDHLFKGMRTRSIGPAGMSGRVTCIDVVLHQPDIIYAGTASGGLWKSTSGGIDWEPIFDKQQVHSIGAVAVQQSNPSVVWAGTGEGNPRNSHTSGGGIYKSLDGGKTWKLMGLEGTKAIHRIIIHRDNSDIVFVAAMGSIWGANEERGVYRTTDGGKTWKQVLYVNDQTGCADMVTDPTNPNKIVAALWEYGRQPWFFNSGGPGSGLYITYDGGATWKLKTEKDGLPKGNLGRIGLSVCHAKPNIIYALVEAKKTALYRSEDGGATWKMQADKNIGNRPFYYADIFVDPQNENRLYNLHSVVTVSEDGGKSFKTLMPYSAVHPDHHAWWIHPHNPDYMIDGNDGGLNITRDGGKHWRFVENLPLAQFYHIDYDMAIPYNVYGGMQDNGSWQGPAYIWKRGGIRNSDWQELVFGDGFDVVPQNGSDRYGYAMYQGGHLYYYDVQTGKSEAVKPVHPEGKYLRFNWNAGIAQDPHNDCGVYFGSQYLHYSKDCGKGWTIISPDLTTNDSTKQKQAKSGGLTIDATRAENYTTITCIAPSALDAKVIWVGTDDGNVQVTKDGGQNWTNVIGNLTGVPRGSWVTQIVASSNNAGEAFAVINNYRRNDWKPYLMHTKDHGQTWKNLVASSKVAGHCLAVAQDPIEPKLLFLGTENGLYISIDGGINWTKWKEQYPSVSTMDLKIHPREHDLIIGTFGRAAYILDDIRPLRALAKEGKGMLDKPFKVFDPPTAYLAQYRSAEGTRFMANAHYYGSNRNYGGMISFWIKDPKSAKDKDDDQEDGDDNGDEEEEKEKKEEKDKDKKDKKKDPNADKVKVMVFDQQGDTIRLYHTKPDTGLNRIWWNLRSNGVRGVSYRETKPGDDIPAGQMVLPGTYKIKLVFKGYADSSKIEVRQDPRIELSTSELQAKLAMIKQHESMARAAYDAFERLKASKKIIKEVNGELETLDDDSLEAKLRKEGKTVGDTLQRFMDRFLTPKDFNGYDHVTVRITDLLDQAHEAVTSAHGQPGATATTAMGIAKKELQAALDDINAFYEGSWKKYQTEVEAAPFKRFKAYEPIKIEEE